MIYRLFLAGCLFLAFLSCSDKRQYESISISQIRVNISSEKDKYTFDDFFEYSHYIALQTTDESLVSRIAKLQITNNRLYIVDTAEKKILIFDHKGNLIRSIRHRGESAQEYINISDIDVDNNGCIYANDNMGKKIIKYDSLGNYVSSMQVPLKGYSFKRLNEHTYIMNLGNSAADKIGDENYNYVCLKDGEVVFTGVPFNKHLRGHRVLNGHGMSSFYMSGGELFMTSILNDTVFKISKEGEVLPHVAYDFGIDKPTVEASNTEIDQYLMSMRNGEVPSSLFHFNKFGDYYMTGYDYNNKVTYVISKMNASPEYVGRFDLDKYGLYILPVSCLSDIPEPFFVSKVSPDDVQSLLENSKDKADKDLSLLKELAEKCKEDDNPILVFYRWKFTGKLN